MDLSSKINPKVPKIEEEQFQRVEDENGQISIEHYKTKLKFKAIIVGNNFFALVGSNFPATDDSHESHIFT